MNFNTKIIIINHKMLRIPFTFINMISFFKRNLREILFKRNIDILFYLIVLLYFNL